MVLEGATIQIQLFGLPWNWLLESYKAAKSAHKFSFGPPPLAAPRRATASTTSSSQRSRGRKEEEGPRPRGRRGGGWSQGRRGGRWGQPRVVHPAQPRMRMGKPEQEQSKHVTVLHRRRCCHLVCQVKSLLQSRSRLPSEVTW